MKSETAPPFDGLKQMEKTLLTLDEIPLLGSPPKIDWKELSSKLSTTFQIEGFTIEPSERKWIEKGELTEGIASPLATVQIKLSPVAGDAYWIISQSDLEKLFGWLVKQEISFPIPEEERDLMGGFYRFLALKVTHLLEESQILGDLSPTLTFGAELPEEPLLGQDLHLSLGDHSIWGRFFITPQLQQSVKRRFTPKKPLHLTSDIASRIDLNVHLEAGHTTLQVEEWKQVASGDLLLLDQCTIDPDGTKQKVLLTVRGQPVLRGRVKDGQLKILEYPILTEMGGTMKDEDEFLDNEMSLDDDDLDLFDEQEELDLDDESDELGGNDPLEGEEELNLEEEAEAPAEEAEGAEEAFPDELEDTEVTAEAAASDSLIKPEQIPMNIIVELGRIQMNAQSLMELQPGNLLDLNFDPNQSVDLVVNGKPVGRGELVKIGEVVGVRVTNIG